ncbi:hypothetical protein KIN20_001653 [Parelaphostrongylus tenuis]|uniref:Uncharacterized protein n=1 Tax=Parelaphostrongylus tenuis TaxID=148309 RepID=A0AAD5MFK4_PARTN|nr:hypothetical protein KIN20_001653 [Parelaphostrongylus tenuis]
MTNLVHARMATKMTNPVHIPWAAKGWWYTNRMPFTDGNDYKDDDQKDAYRFLRAIDETQQQGMQMGG